MRSTLHHGIVRIWPALATSIGLAACMPSPAAPFAQSLAISTPEVAARTAFTSIHGQKLQQPFGWLQDPDDPEVRAYLDAENAYAESVMEDLGGLRKTLYDEMQERSTQSIDRSAPLRIGNFSYYSEQAAHQDHPVFFRQAHGEDSPPERLLDDNELAASGSFHSVYHRVVSPDSRYLAYTVDPDGSEAHSLYVKDLHKGELLPEVIDSVAYSVVWSRDSQHLFYTTYDDSGRPDRVWRHRVGTLASQDILVHADPVEGSWVFLESTPRNEQVLIKSYGAIDYELHYLSGENPTGKPQRLYPRSDDLQIEVYASGEYFYILAGEHMPTERVVRVPIADPGLERWEELIPLRPSVTIERIATFRQHLVALEREAGLRRLHVINLETGEGHHVPFEEAAYTLNWLQDQALDSSRLRFEYSTMVTPPTIVEYDMNTRRQTELQRDEFQGHEASNYRTERLFATAEDGTLVPISLAYHKDALSKGGAPVYLYGFGAYGITVDPEFNADRLSLLDRGLIYAIAHVRGGGLLGTAWHAAGSAVKRETGIADLIIVAEHLVEAGYAQEGRIAVRGSSAGGLLTAASINARPDLFAAGLLELPFVDLLTVMLDESQPLTVQGYAEFGDPRDPEQFAVMKRISPVDRVSAQEYPPLLIMTALQDTRTPYWEGAKLAATLRQRKTDQNPLLLLTDMGAGHAGASGRVARLWERATWMAFMLEALGVET